MTKPFLKWAGGKSRLLGTISPHLNGKRLLEPFAGSCAVFLGTDFERAILVDVNADLIALYTNLQGDGARDFIAETYRYFTPDTNTLDTFTRLRNRFNALEPGNRERAQLFIYLNRHAYNGLCRYNRSGGFNVPFGKYAHAPGFPQEALENFVARAAHSTFLHQGYLDTFQMAQPGDVIYADPPYAPLSVTASFSAYAKEGFGWDDHIGLAQAAQRAAARGVKTIVSNHATPAILDLYAQHGGDCAIQLDVRRSVSAKGDKRGHAKEVLAIFAA